MMMYLLDTSAVAFLAFFIAITYAQDCNNLVSGLSVTPNPVYTNDGSVTISWNYEPPNLMAPPPPAPPPAPPVPPPVSVTPPVSVNSTISAPPVSVPPVSVPPVSVPSQSGGSSSSSSSSTSPSTSVITTPSTSNPAVASSSTSPAVNTIQATAPTTSTTTTNTNPSTQATAPAANSPRGPPASANDPTATTSADDPATTSANDPATTSANDPATANNPNPNDTPTDAPKSPANDPNTDTPTDAPKSPANNPSPPTEPSANDPSPTGSPKGLKIRDLAVCDATTIQNVYFDIYTGGCGGIDKKQTVSISQNSFSFPASDLGCEGQWTVLLRYTYNGVDGIMASSSITVLASNVVSVSVSITTTIISVNSVGSTVTVKQVETKTGVVTPSYTLVTYLSAIPLATATISEPSTTIVSISFSTGTFSSYSALAVLDGGNITLGPADGSYSDGSSGISTGVIAGIAAAGVGCVAAIIIFATLIRKRNNRRSQGPSVLPTTFNDNDLSRGYPSPPLEHTFPSHVPDDQYSNLQTAPTGYNQASHLDPFYQGQSNGFNYLTPMQYVGPEPTYVMPYAQGEEDMGSQTLGDAGRNTISTFPSSSQPGSPNTFPLRYDQQSEARNSIYTEPASPRSNPLRSDQSEGRNSIYIDSQPGSPRVTPLRPGHLLRYEPSETRSSTHSDLSSGSATTNSPLIRRNVPDTRDESLREEVEQ